jgi:NADH-quinone oxidoreductase subunit N
MDAMNLSQALSFVKPEISISITLLVVVLFDLIFHKDKRIIPYIAMLGVIITGIILVNDFNLTGTAFKTGGNYGMFTADPFGNFVKMIVLIATFLIILFGYDSDEIKKTKDRLGEYYALIFGMVLGMFFLISASDLILIYLSMELLSLSSYVLAGFTKLRDRNSEAALKYLIYGAISSGLMLFGISLVYGMTGSTNLFQINALIQNPDIDLYTFAFAMILIFAGIGYKISAVPFHYWTPDVYEGAPITITSFLSVASKAAGFALLIRFLRVGFVTYIDKAGNWQVLNLFDWQALLILISVLTMTLGNFAALWQDNLKRMLAYSSIAHAGYMLLGVLVLSDKGVTAVLFYFFVYLIMNLGAFYIVMLIANKTGNENIDDYDGLGFTSPFLGVTIGIFLISLAGLPPTAGFVGKFYLFVALLDAKMAVVAAIAVINSVVSLYYYIRVLKHMYLTKNENAPVIPVSKLAYSIVLVLSTATLLFGIYFTPISNWAKSAAVILGLK